MWRFFGSISLYWAFNFCYIFFFFYNFLLLYLLFYYLFVLFFFLMSFFYRLLLFLVIFFYINFNVFLFFHFPSFYISISEAVLCDIVLIFFFFGYVLLSWDFIKNFVDYTDPEDFKFVDFFVLFFWMNIIMLLFFIYLYFVHNCLTGGCFLNNNSYLYFFTHLVNVSDFGMMLY